MRIQYWNKCFFLQMSLPSSANRKDVEANPKDDEVLSSIRNVRRMVEQEFGQAQRRRKKRTLGVQKDKSETEDQVDEVGNDGAFVTNEEDKGEDNKEYTEDDASWKSKCFQLKQQLFEERIKAKRLAKKYKDELFEASSKVKDAIAEASLCREMKETLVETVMAQRKQSDGLSKELIQSRKNAKALETIWKDLIQTMEEEKEAMNRERETSLRLLEETQQRLASSLVEQDRIKRDADTRSKELEKRIKELESVERPILPAKGRNNSETPPSYWNKSETRSVLQQKLKELEESLGIDSDIIQSFERQIAATWKNPKTTTLKKSSDNLSTENATVTAGVSTASSVLATKTSQLRSKSLSVLENVIQLQLQRLMEIHSQKTTSKNNNDDEEWKSILRKMSENRAKVLDLRNESKATTAKALNRKKKRHGASSMQVDESSPTKKAKTRKD